MKLNKKLLGAYKYVASSPEGQQIIQDLLDVSGFNDFSDTNDPLAMAYKNGKRDMYLYVKTMVEQE